MTNFQERPLSSPAPPAASAALPRWPSPMGAHVLIHYGSGVKEAKPSSPKSARPAAALTPWPPIFPRRTAHTSSPGRSAP